MSSSGAAPAHAKQHVSFVVIGHSQCGKSTAVGAMLKLANSVEDDTFDAIEAAANTAGQTMRRFAWISDKTKEERERLHTITPKLWCLDGDEHQMSLIDTPGHRSCTLMCIASMCMADAALVVVSGKRGDFEHGISSEGKPLPCTHAHVPCDPSPLTRHLQAAPACNFLQRTRWASKALLWL
jgi:elongation factor 1-alpha